MYDNETSLTCWRYGGNWQVIANLQFLSVSQIEPHIDLLLFYSIALINFLKIIYVKLIILLLIRKYTQTPKINLLFRK